jgi:hypothetical protein
LSHNRDYSPKENTNSSFVENRWQLVSLFIFFSHYNTILFLTLVLAPPKPRRKINTAICGAAPQNPKTKLAGKLTQAFSLFFLAWGCTLL